MVHQRLRMSRLDLPRENFFSCFPKGDVSFFLLGN